MPAQAERRAACCELVAEVARHAGEVRLKLNGTSMLPAMWPGDVVTVQRCDFTQLRTGQVVLYRSHGNLVAHRIMHIFSDRLITRGDSIPHCDSPVSSSAIVGRVVSVVRNDRSVSMKHAWLHRALATILSRSRVSLRITMRWRDWTRKRERSGAASGAVSGRIDTAAQC